MGTPNLRGAFHRHMQHPAVYRINGLVRLSLSNSSSYIITRDPRKSKSGTITRSQNFKVKRLGVTQQPIPSFALAVQTLLCRPAPQTFAASTFLYPPANSARSLKEQQPSVVGRGLIRSDQSPHGSPTLGQDGPKLPCPDLWDHKRPADQGSMSQRPAASRPVSQSTAAGLNERPPADTFRGQEGQHGGLDHGDRISREQNLQELSHQPASQPPAQSYPPMTPNNTRPSGGASRGVGVHTMLNPTESATSRVYSTFGSDAQMALVDPSLPQQTTGAEIPTPASHLNHPPNSSGLLSTNAAFEGRRRRSLAPNVHRSVSLGNAEMGAQRPFGQSEHDGGRPHIVVPGSDASSEIPPVPAIPVLIRSPFSLPPPVSGPPLNRRASVAVMGGPTARLPNSQSASPNSPYSYSSHPSPAPMTQVTQPPAGPPYFTGSTLRGAFPEGGSSQAGQQQPGSYMTHLSARIPLQGPTSGGHDPNSLILSTENGELVVPLDVEVGSLEAGERRKRNASASARFRGRTKEKKERENKEINELERKNQDMARELEYMTEERDFYRAERRRFWQMLDDNPATRDIALREQRSPRFPPRPLPDRPPSGSLESPGGDTSQSERPARRRRLDNQEEYEHPSNQPRPEEGQNIQYAPLATPYAPAQPRPEGGQYTQYPPPQIRSVSGPGAGSNWLLNTAAQHPPSVFYSQGGSSRPWPSGQLPQPSQVQQQTQQQSPQEARQNAQLSQYQAYQALHQAHAPQQPQYQVQHQAHQQAQQPAPHQAQHQAHQQAQQPAPQQGDPSGQRQ
ncbi:hypothetical protein V500_03370 [Pseudogymnoascus sp. VKM F-4518 (FW-2643)]|nr:hypothetical protein V500_03370 [Pseudogymnoascus sp. VKM F-4518 (FW-2643)]